MSADDLLDRWSAALRRAQGFELGTPEWEQALAEADLLADEWNARPEAAGG